MPELTTRLVAMMSDRIRERTRIGQQRDRLVSLGKLSAGLAHELNNPASAAKRASDQMREMLAKLRNANSELWRQSLDDSDKARIEEAEASLLQSGTQLDGLALGAWKKDWIQSCGVMATLIHGNCQLPWQSAICPRISSPPC